MTSDWYRPSSHDRSVIGQRKVDELQKQITSMESEMREQSDLMHKLNRLQTIENEKRDFDDRVLERNSSRNSRNSRNSTSPRLIRSEMERLYGRESKNLNDRNKSPAMDKKLIDTMIQQRTKEFSQKQQEAAMKAKYLDKERQRLQEARRRVEEQRQALLNTSSPTGKPPYYFHNDKLYVPHEPYRFFEDKYERIRDSFVLPIPKPEPRSVKGNYKLRLKYLPVPLEDSNTWTRYQRQIHEEEDIDEAVLAFQSLTSKNLRQRKRTRVKYLPQRTHDVGERSLSENVGNYRQDMYQTTDDRFNGTVSADNFHKSFKFGAIHDGYRLMGDRIGPHDSSEISKPNMNLNDPRNRGISNSNLPDYRYHYNSQYNVNINTSQENHEPGRTKAKVRFRATPAYDDHSIRNEHARS